MQICALIFIAPYYDCSDTWRIEVYNSVDFICTSGAGCADYRQNTIYLKESLLHPESDLLGHELKHLKCYNYYNPRICTGHFDNPQNWDRWHV